MWFGQKSRGRWNGSIASFMIGSVEEGGDGHLENASDLEKPAGADAIGAVLVFLHLLEGQVEFSGEFCLGYFSRKTQKPDIAADQLVDCVAPSFRHSIRSFLNGPRRAL